ncbi:MAG: hypothetical protein EKK55_02105, partial [Rhodocyclaceae bacterium]
MSIRLLEAISIAGVDKPIGTTVNGSADWEAGLVASNKAVYVDRVLAPGEGRVPAEFLLDDEGNVTGLVGPDGITNMDMPLSPVRVATFG